MDPSEFADNCPGHLVPTTFTETAWRNDRWKAEALEGAAFVPDPLPPRLPVAEFLLDLYPAIIGAERNLSLLEGAARRLSNPHLLIRLFAQREAILSSAIEDTIASPEELALFHVAPTETQELSSIREVHNYVRALEHGLQSARPISLNLIREMHAILLAGVLRPGVNPGEFRSAQNAIVRGGPFRNASFVPPPPSHLMQCLHDLEDYFHATDSVLPRLMRLALIHYQFEAIHPFADGNGRLGRLLVTYFLCEQGQLTKPLLYVSAFFERNRDDYCALLKRVSTHGAWKEWSAFFLEAVASQSADAITRADGLFELQQDYYRRVREKRASPLLPQLIDQLFDNPATSAALVERQLPCSPPTALALINRLVDKRILVEATGRKRDRVFVAPGILNLVRS